MKYAHRDEAAVQVQKGARALLARRELARRVREKELWQVSPGIGLKSVSMSMSMSMSISISKV